MFICTNIVPSILNKKLLLSILPIVLIAGVTPFLFFDESELLDVESSSITSQASVQSIAPILVEETTKPRTQEGVGFHGVVELIAHDKDGQLLSYHKQSNLVVHEGLNTALDLMFPDINLNSNATDSEFDWIRIGTGTTDPANGDTGIETAIGGCDAQQDGTVTGGSAAGGTAWAYLSVQFSGDDCPGTITESVLANSSTGGEILSRLEDATGTTIGSGDTLTVNWNFTASDSNGT